jgi:dihydrofolate reductase
MIVTQLLKLQCFGLSSDGFGSGEGQSLEQPFGHANPADLLSWAGATASWVNRTDPGGSRGLDDYFTRDMTRGMGAEIMGRNKFGPLRGPWQDESWKGWWGENPPFHTPVFVLTHFERPSFTLSDTTFHFLDATPQEALRKAKEAANGKDVRLGGGVATVREFLDADLLDTLHVAVAPVELGRGERLWRSPDELLDRFHLEIIPSPSGIKHHLFWRR